MNSNKIAILIYEAFGICIVESDTEIEILKKVDQSNVGIELISKYLIKYIEVKTQENIQKEYNKKIALAQLNLLFKEDEEAIYNYHGEKLDTEYEDEEKSPPKFEAFINCCRG